MRQDRKKLRKNPDKWNEVGANNLLPEPGPLGMIREKQFMAGKPLWWLQRSMTRLARIR